MSSHMATQFVAFEPVAYVTALSALLLQGRRRFLIRGLTPTAMAFATMAQPLKAAFPFTFDGADRSRGAEWPANLVKAVPSERLATGSPDTRYDAVFVFVVDSLNDVLHDYENVLDTTAIVAPAVPHVGPAVPIVALPKSGGTWLAASLAQGLGTSVSYSSWNTFPSRTIEAITLERAVRAGHVLHEHADASPLNVQALQALAPKIVLHVRDPRGALLSLGHYLRHQLEHGTRVPTGLLHMYPATPPVVARGPIDAFIDWALTETLSVWVTWLSEWLAVADARGPLDVLITDHAELEREPEALLRRILGFYGIALARLRKSDVPKTMETFNFRAGNPREWQGVFTPAQRSIAARLVPDDMKQRFGWPDA
jgi:hypothetical protein